MYTLTHEGESVGTTSLERGDPSAFAVSGVFNNMGGAKALAGWIKSVGGEEDDGVVFLALNNDFELIDEEGNAIKFADAHLIAVPNEDEAYLDITGVPEADYKNYFPAHLLALNNAE